MLMRVVNKIDRRLHGTLRRIYWRVGAAEPIRERVERMRLRKRNPFSMEIVYRSNAASQLSSLCDLYGSDKGELQKGESSRLRTWPVQTRRDFYEMLFEHKREAVRSVIECGVGTNNPSLESSMGMMGKPGASLRVWRDYFPQADIVGIDIDKAILFTEDRIQTYYCDQTNAQSVKEFKMSRYKPVWSILSLMTVYTNSVPEMPLREHF